MLIQISPVLIAVLATLFLGERFTRWLAVGLVLAFAGVVLIGVSQPGGHNDLVGVLLCLLAALVYSVALVVQKPLVSRLSALHVTWLACTVGAVACLPFAGQLVSADRRRLGVRHLVGGLPRAVPDRDRVHDVRLRPAAHDRRAAWASRPTSCRR